MDNVKIFKGWPPRDAPSKLVQLWYKTFPPWSGAVCCSVLQCVAVCCSVLQCVAVCCSELQCVAVCCRDQHGLAEMKTQLDGVIKPVPHDLARKIRFWRIKISGT